MGRKLCGEVLLTTCLFLLSSSLTSCQSGLIRSYDWRLTGLDDDIRQNSAPSSPLIPSSGPSSSFEDDDEPTRYQDYSGPHNSPFFQDLSSYPKEPLNITAARIGGFAGSGDTKGFGAYDFPRANEVSTEDEDLDGDEEFRVPLREILRPRYRSREGRAHRRPLPYVL